MTDRIQENVDLSKATRKGYDQEAGKDVIKDEYKEQAVEQLVGLGEDEEKSRFDTLKRTNVPDARGFGKPNTDYVIKDNKTNETKTVSVPRK